MTSDARSSGVDHQITALTEIIGALSTTVERLSDRVERLEANRSRDQSDTGDSHEPAAWVWFTPPAAAENEPDTTEDPRFTVDNFVAWYNITYVGVEGSRATRIPSCWQQHPGLAMEIATLTYSWREANTGPSASPREAQYWHHQWRPGFTDRLAREWVHTDCIDGEHRAAGADER